MPAAGDVRLILRIVCLCAKTYATETGTRRKQAYRKETRRIIDYAWKELPQPHDLTAFGLSKVKPRFSMLS